MQATIPDHQHMPVPSTSLVGRSGEVARIIDLLARADVRLVTLTGPGGVGKTRLALQIAHEIDRGAVDVRLVLLASSPDLAGAIAAIARALGVRQIETEPPEQRIIETIADRAMLLILDNAEHIADRLTVVSTLLARCPNLTILVTSRVILRLSAERIVPVEPLSTERPSSDQPAPAAALFIERALAVTPDLPMGRDDLLAIDDICRRVDGLPLAIELAAARTRFFGPLALRDRLSERLSVLVGGPRDAPERHRTLHATLTWSHDLLTDEERTLFRRLAVFQNGCPWDAVTPVCNADNALVDVEATLAELIDHSLVRIVTTPATGARVRMLHTVREFAREQLELSRDHESVRDAHAAWFADMVITTPDATWSTGTPELREWTTRHEPDLGNFSLALERLMGREDRTAVVQLVGNLVMFWYELGHLREGRVWTQQAMPFVTAAPDRAQLRFYSMAGIMALISDAPEEALSYTTTALAFAERLGDPRPIANCRNLLGSVHWRLGNAEEGERLQRSAIAAIQQTSDKLGGALFSAQIAEHLMETGHPKRAEPLFRQALAIIEQHRPEALPLFQGSLAYLLLRREALDEAGALFEASLAYHRDPPHRQPSMLALRLLHAAWLAARRHAARDGARLVGAAHRVGEMTGDGISQLVDDDIREVAHQLASLLGEAEYASQVAIGRAMSTPEAIELAMTVARLRSDADAADDATHGLTPRQMDVLRLLAEGRSNADIAEALFISERTVTTHLTRIYESLGVSTRGQAIALAARLGLVTAGQS